MVPRSLQREGWSVSLWDVETGRLTATLEHIWDIGNLVSVAFSPDGKTIASVGQKTINLWNTETGHLISTFEGHTSNITSVSFSPDGTIIASSSWDGTILLWALLE